MDPRQRTLLLGAVGVVLLTASVIGILVLAGLRSKSEVAEASAAKQTPSERQKDVAANESAGPGAIAAPEAGGLAPFESPAMKLVVRKDGVQRIACDTACRLEEQCGLRTLADCRTRSCEDDVRKTNRSDFALGAASTCAEMALVPCEEACWRRGECTGGHESDAACQAACRTLVLQQPVETYRENRCVLESACEDLPLCAGAAP